MCHSIVLVSRVCVICVAAGNLLQVSLCVCFVLLCLLCVFVFFDLGVGCMFVWLKGSVVLCM